MLGTLGLIVGNPLYRWVAVAGLLAATWTHGAVHGMRYEQNKEQVAEAQVIIVQKNNAAVLNKNLSDQLFAEKAVSDLAAARNAQLVGQLAAALAKKPTLITPMCEHGQEVADQLNALIKNNRRSTP